ncbi:Trk-type K+ transport system membrane component OS=Ureibacillus acetophenoni OX=614649 GN=SAMN05877842_101279 PE=4 SV=1 [Ureibacillus acetophenoni]
MRGRQLIMIDHNQYNLSGVVHLLKEIVKILFVIEFLGAVVLTVHFLRYYDSFSEALKHGIFTSISATTNSGFTLTGNSLQPFSSDYFVQFVVMILIVLGAIGFPVLVEIKKYLSRIDPSFRFSLFTKITTATYGILFLVGTIGIFIVGMISIFSRNALA